MTSTFPGHLSRVRGTGLTEVVVAMGLIATLTVPILSASSLGVRRTRRDRARVVATMLAANVLARLGHAGSEFDAYLKPAGPGTRAIDDVLSHPAIAGDVGAGPLAGIVAAHQMQFRYSRSSGALPGAEMLRCEVWWKPSSKANEEDEHVTIERLLVAGAL